MSATYNLKKLISDSEHIWKQLRWESTGGVPTCTCGCQETYVTSKGLYKCKHCGRMFSDRSGTLLHHSKLPTWIWLVSIYKFSTITECSAITLQKEVGVNYKTAYLILQKLRYVSSFDKQILEGVIKIDEAYIGAWSCMHFNKKIQYLIDNGYMQPGERYKKTDILRASSAKKYHTLSITDEKGSNVLLHCPNPITKTTIKSILMREGIGVTGIVSDESGLYRDLGIQVFQSNHSRHIFTSPEGHSSNVCENRFSWVKRKWNGVYSHTGEKYLQLYLWQRQWSYNNKELSTDDRFRKFVGICCSHKVTYKTISRFNYKSRFPRSRREVEAEQCQDLMNSCGGIISSVTDSYGRTYR